MKVALKILGCLVIYLAVILGTAFFSFPKPSEAFPEVKKQAGEVFSYHVDGALPSGISRQDVSVLIVPHHLVADKQIRDAFAHTTAARANTKTRRIILMGPNHFFRGEAQIITDRRNWQTNYGEITPDYEFISLLNANNFAKEEENILNNDHAITALLPFVERFFPDAAFVPLLVREPMSRLDAEAFGNFLAQNIEPEDIIIASIDFSHYFPKDVADAHDKESIAALKSLDIDFFEKKMDVDSRQILMALSFYLKQRSHTNFTLLDHTNSAVLTGNPHEISTTSHILGFYSAEK